MIIVLLRAEMQFVTYYRTLHIQHFDFAFMPSVTNAFCPCNLISSVCG